MKARKTLRGKPVNVRLDPDVEEDIEKIAAQTRLPKVEILRQCARAGAEAIAQNGYELPAPLRMRIVKSEGLDQTLPAQTKRRLAS